MFISNILKKLNRRDTNFFSKLTKANKIVFILVILVLVTLISRQILATDNTSNTDNTFTQYINKQNAITKGNNQESWINEALLSNLVSLNQAFAGPLSEDVLTGKANFVPGGIIGFANQSVASLYTPPASGVEYIADTFNNFLGKPVYAQGAVTHLSGILSLWKGFRNSVYTLFSIVFVIIGIAIMLRIKISPQAVITVQTIIPKLITTLVLVTFSYAIAGLLIDAVYIFQGIFLSIIFNSNGGINSKLFTGIINPTFSQLMNADFWQTYKLATRAASHNMLEGMSILVHEEIQGAVGLLDFGTALGKIIIGGVALSIIMLVIYVMTLIYIIKFFFGMIKCYLHVIVRIVLGPLEIALGAIPNVKMGITSWMLNLVANLAVFPSAIIFLVLVNLIIDKVGVDGTGNLWSPPMLAGRGILGPALGIGALMILSKLPTLIPELVFKIKPSGFGKALGESVAPYSKAAKGIAGMPISAARESSGEALEERLKRGRLYGFIKGKEKKGGNKDGGLNDQQPTGTPPVTS